VLYTSGSTGTPKGVEVGHRALVNLLESMREEPGLRGDDVLLGVTRISFDIAALELYLPLMVGARLVIAPRETSTDGRRLAEAIETSGATVMQATPATWHLLLQGGWKGNARLRILCGGEALSEDLSAALLAKVDSLWNVYGPTETTIWSTIWKAEAGATSIGRPIANTQVHLLDASLEPVAPGTPGELYIGGEGVARGYLGKPELTAGKFVPDPFGEPGRRLFRTGDLAVYRPDGNLRFLGRIDNQVKIHGHRIEPGEIEAVLTGDPAIQQAIVIAREDIPGDKRLVAYLVPSPGQVVAIDQVRLALMSELPPYMVPSAFVVLDRLPLTPSGKVDRRALPPPGQSRQSRVDSRSDFVAPRDRLERQLIRIWEKLLRRDSVGIDDDFFKLGGHSLLGARLFVEIERRLGKFLPVATLFQAPTVKQLAQVIRQEDRGSPAWTSLIELKRSGSKAPFFWVHGDASNVLLGHHLGPDRPLYGFLHQAADGEPARHVTVEDIASHYLEELRSVQGKGPYVLGGYSFGAVVAFEMAQRLRRAGHEVALLFLLFPGAPPGGTLSADERHRPRSRLGAVRSEVGRNLRELAQLGPRKKLARIIPGVKARLQAQAITVRVSVGLRLPPSVRSRYIRDIYFRAYRSYVPRPYPSPTLVVGEKECPDEERYWRALLTGDVEMHWLPAGHYDVIAPPYLQAWAERLRDGLRRTDIDAALEVLRSPGRRRAMGHP
jgi:thioesterase domain-containing protein